MAVPTQPSVATRAVYYPYIVPTPTVTIPTAPSQGGGAAALNNPTVTYSGVAGDVGTGGVPLPATVLSVGGTTPDWVGTKLIVHLPDGTTTIRYSGFQPGQAMPSVATWASGGSNPAIARWAMVDAAS